MNILLTGAGGQIGSALRKTAPAGVKLFACYRQLAEHADADACSVDLGDADQVAALLRQHRFDVIINAAAWTAVDEAESQPEAAFRMNAGLPQQLAEHALAERIALLHYSSDYVYAGNKHGDYIETDAPAPLNVYGRSKLAGDAAIIATACDHLILRTSWVYGGPGKNFLYSIAERLLQGAAVSVVDDQLGCPTWSEDIARCSWQALSCMRVQQTFNSGLYHLSGSEAMSWYDFAEQIRQTLLQQKALPQSASVSACTSSSYPQQAPRPARSVLDCAAFRQQFGCSPAGVESIHQATLNYLHKQPAGHKGARR